MSVMDVLTGVWWAICAGVSGYFVGCWHTSKQQDTTRDTFKVNLDGKEVSSWSVIHPAGKDRTFTTNLTTPPPDEKGK